MSTQTEESVESIVSLEGILETSFFQGIVPITKEEEERVQKKLEGDLIKDSHKKGDVLGDLLPYEKALFIRVLVMQMETEKEEGKMGDHPLHFLMTVLSGDEKKIEALETVRKKKKKADQLTGIFWALIHDRFADELSDEKVTGLLINSQFQVVTTLADENSAPCPGCGKYHA